MTQKDNLRDLKDGNWYWIERALLQVHGRTLKASGIAVYNVLASFANSESQSCFPGQKAIAKLVGLSNKTVMRKIKLLQDLGLIEVERMQSGNRYYLLKTKGAETEGVVIGDRVAPSEVTPGKTNDTYPSRENINNNVAEHIPGFVRITPSGFAPRTREGLLALDLANALGDHHSLACYLSYARRYPESLLRKVLGEVKETPPDRIKKSRAALFTYLLRKYVQGTFEDTRHQAGDQVSGVCVLPGHGASGLGSEGQQGEMVKEETEENRDHPLETSEPVQAEHPSAEEAPPVAEFRKSEDAGEPHQTVS